MDIKKDETLQEEIPVVEEIEEKSSENGAPMSALTEETELAPEFDLEDSAQKTVCESGNWEAYVSPPFRSDMERAALPFPAKDYNKKGNLKKVRARVMKKLLKNEWRYYFPITLALMGIVVIVGLIYGFILRKDMTMEEYDPSFTFVTLVGSLVFLLSFAGGILFSQIYPVLRYNKSFFQNEGYLTFSIPASAEEQVFAKRIAAVLCTLGMTAAIVLGGFLAAWISGGFQGTFEDFRFELELLLGVSFSSTGDVVLSVIENVLSAIVGIFMLPAMYGAISCALSKSAGKKKTFTVLILVFLGVTVLESIFSYVLIFGTAWIPATSAGVHISAWVTLLLEVGLTVGCTYFEIWYLKNKLDLK